MITEEQVSSREVREDTRVYYTKKDGNRIYGTVRNIYLDKKMLSMKPDPVDENDPAYPQTYRFRRLTVEGKLEFFGLQLAPLVVTASSKTTPEKLQRIFSCRDGLFVTDGKKLVLEKIKGLKDGYVKDEELWELTRKKIQDQGKFCDDIIWARINAQVKEYYNFKQGRRVAGLLVNSKDFNRFVKSIPYSTGQYHAKWSDVATLVIKSGIVEVDIFDKHCELCGLYPAEVLEVNGSITASYMLYDLREMVKNIRTRKYRIEISSDGTLVIDTDEQFRILYSLEGTIKKANVRKRIYARRKR